MSRSIQYSMFLCFEGIRFHVKKNAGGGLDVTLLNWHRNLERLRRGIAFNLGQDQQDWIPSAEELEAVFIHKYFKDPAVRPVPRGDGRPGRPGISPPVHGRRGTLDGGHVPQPAGHPRPGLPL